MMSNKKFVVVPLDGSPLAEKALPYGVALARLEQLDLLLLKVEQTNESFSKSSGLNSQEVEEASSYLELVKKEISQEELPNWLSFERIETKVVTGRSPRELGEIINSLGALQVVMSTHGRTGLTRFLLGSIARETLEHLQAPVILIRPLALEESALPAEMMYQKTGLPKPGEKATGRIAVALDGSPEAEAVLQPALQICKVSGCGLTLLKVMPDYNPLTSSVNYSMIEEINRNKIKAWQYLEGVKSTLAETAVEVTLKVLIGEPATAILDYANSAEGKVVLLAMASHTRSRLSRLMQGSVAEEVLDESHLPVLMVHRS